MHIPFRMFPDVSGCLTAKPPLVSSRWQNHDPNIVVSWPCTVWISASSGSLCSLAYLWHHWDTKLVECPIGEVTNYSETAKYFNTPTSEGCGNNMPERKRHILDSGTLESVLSSEYVAAQWYSLLSFAEHLVVCNLLCRHLHHGHQTLCARTVAALIIEPR
jgi:hypothetical protein